MWGFSYRFKINLLSPKGCAHPNLVKVPKLNFPSLQREMSMVPRMQSLSSDIPLERGTTAKSQSSDYLDLGTIYTLRFLDSHADSTNYYCCASSFRKCQYDLPILLRSDKVKSDDGHIA